MTKQAKGSADRGKQVIRILHLAFKLSKRSMSINAIAEMNGTCHKTARRDIRVLEEVGIPVYRHERELETEFVTRHGRDSSISVTGYRIDHDFMKRFI